MPKAVKKTPSAEIAEESLPALIMVVDEDLSIKEFNGPAREFIGPDHADLLQKRSGDAFDCHHSKDATEGCGFGKFCQICPIREAVTEALQQHQVVRRRTKAEMGSLGKTREAHLLVTATPLPARGSGRVLLVLEDISALMELQDPVPICTHCQRIRDDDHYWETMEVHFRQHFDLDLSSGLCPACKEQYYGHLIGRRDIRDQQP
jgi:hypothetical protein